MATLTTITEASILEKVSGAGRRRHGPRRCSCNFNFKFDSITTKKIRRLLQKNNRGTITAQERILLEKYLRVGKLIDLLHAKARRSTTSSR